MANHKVSKVIVDTLYMFTILHMMIVYTLQVLKNMQVVEVVFDDFYTNTILTSQRLRVHFVPGF